MSGSGTGRLGGLDGDQAAKLDKMREAITTLLADSERRGTLEKGVPEEIEKLTDADLLRFLRARKFEIEDAYTMLRECCEWRVTFGVDSITLDEVRENISKGASFFRNVDKEGRPINWVQVKIHKKGERPLEEVQRACIFWMEHGVSVLDEMNTKESLSTSAVDYKNADNVKESKDSNDANESDKSSSSSKSPHDAFTLVFDMNGFSLINMDYGFIKFLVSAFEKYYPERLGKGLIVDAPWLFWGCWKIISPWLDKRTASKIHFVSKEELKSHVDDTSIMGFLGGKDDWQFEIDFEDRHKKKEKADGTEEITKTLEESSIGNAEAKKEGDDTAPETKDE